MCVFDIITTLSNCSLLLVAKYFVPQSRKFSRGTPVLAEPPDQCNILRFLSIQSAEIKM